MKIRITRWTRTTSMVFGFAALLLTLSACGDPNPLIGRWQLDNDSSTGLAGAGAFLSEQFTGKGIVEFREDKILIGDSAESVSYEVTEDRVIVTGADGTGVVYSIEGEDRIVIEKSSGNVVFVRVTPAVATGTE